MGVENNECVIATTWDEKAIRYIKDWVETLDKPSQSLFAFILGTANNKVTIFLAPSGSKKGWDEDIAAAKLRERLIEKIQLFDYSDGSSPFDWVEVGYGEFGQKVLRGNCKNCYSDAEYAQ